jgi:hypothetical protein
VSCSPRVSWIAAPPSGRMRQRSDTYFTPSASARWTAAAASPEGPRRSCRRAAAL